MASTFDPNEPATRTLLSALWVAIAANSAIDAFHEKIYPHAKSIFLGYADITLGIPTVGGHLFVFKVRGFGVKLLNGKPHLDMPQEESKTESGKFFPKAFPKTAIDRHLITTMIFADQRVKDAIERGVAQQVAKLAAEAAGSVSGEELPLIEGEPELGTVGASTANPFS